MISYQRLRVAVPLPRKGKWSFTMRGRVRLYSQIISVGPILGSASSRMASVIHYPKSRRDENAVNDYHGSKIHDPYVWLEDPDSEETKRFIEQQNAITMPYLSACETRENFKNRYKCGLCFRTKVTQEITSPRFHLVDSIP